MTSIIGQQFGPWTALEFSHKDQHNNHYYKCRCVCGTERVIYRGNLQTKRRALCGCIKGIANRKLPFESLYNRFLRDSRRRDLSVELTFSDFLQFTRVNVCHYCGDPVVWSEHGSLGGYNLDRKDNLKGYSPDNCIVCCGVCNRMKNTMTHSEFIEKCKSIGKLAF